MAIVEIIGTNRSILHNASVRRVSAGGAESGAGRAGGAPGVGGAVGSSSSQTSSSDAYHDVSGDNEYDS